MAKSAAQLLYGPVLVRLFYWNSDLYIVCQIYIICEPGGDGAPAVAVKRVESLP